MQNVSDTVDLVTPAPKCCFWWEIARGPHANASFALCLHDGARTGERESYKVGRHKHCWMRLLSDLEVSSTHAEFRVVASLEASRAATSAAMRHQVVLCDLRSTNGTKLNGELLVPHREYALADHDLIQFGKTAARFRVAVPLPPQPVMPEVIALESDDDDACGSAEDSERQLTQLREDSVDSAKSESASVLLEPQSDSVSVDASRATTTTTTTTTTVDAGSLASATSASLTDVTPSAQLNSAAPVSSVTCMSDSDEFEAIAPRRMRQLTTARAVESEPSAAASSAATMACMICNHRLDHLDVLEQQLHINGCLDGRAEQVASWSFVQRERNVASNTNGARRRLKRPRSAALSPDNDDEVAMAVALSKSTMSKEQEVDMDLALLSGELAQLDAQMAKLAKKREALVRKLSKLEKTKARVQRSVVLAPTEARVLLDLTKALGVLFPSTRQVADRRGRAEVRTRAVAERYKPQTCAPADSCSTWTLPPMWLRASQLQFGLDAADLYRNSVLRPFGEAFDEFDAPSAVPN